MAELSLHPHHINPFTGLPCNCHWGKPKPARLMFGRTASQAVRQIRNQNQRAFRDEEGQNYLNAVEALADEYPGLEPMVPWFAQQYKKGELVLTPNDWGAHDIQYKAYEGAYPSNITNQLLSWIQWMGARQHPLRRGVNIMELNPREVSERANELRRQQAEKATVDNWKRRWGPDTGLHAWTFDPSQAGDDHDEDVLKKHEGWSVKQLTDPHHAEAESDALGHCIGQEGQPYTQAIRDGHIEAYSLRDHRGFPRMTWHFNPDGTLAHVQGRGTEKDEWRHLITLFNEANGKDDDEGGPGREDDLDEYNYDAEVNLPDPRDVDDYLGQYHPEADIYEWAHDISDNVGENTEVVHGDPQWDEIYDDLRHANPDTRHNFYHTVLWNTPTGPPNHHEQFDYHVQRAQSDEDPDEIDQQIRQEWNQAYQRSFDAQGRFRSPTYDYNGGSYTWNSQWEKMNQPLFQDRGDPSYPTYMMRNSPAQDPFELEGITPQNRVTPRGTFSTVSNILDPIHPALSELVWNDPSKPRPRLKPDHRRWIMREIFELGAQFEPNPDSWLSLVLTGSLTTYQYSDSSDCDVSLFVDPFKLPEWDRAKLIGMMISHLDGKRLPGTPYEMQCFVVAKNISKSDLYQPGLRSGYDLMTDTWIIPPDPTRSHDVAREQNADYIYALESADKMERLLRYEPQKAIQYWHQIHKRRQRDQIAGKGDYSQANIVYKFLANRGLFPQISDVSGEHIAKTADFDPGEWNQEVHGQLPQRTCPKCGGGIATAGERHFCTNCGTTYPFLAEQAPDAPPLGHPADWS